MAKIRLNNVRLSFPNLFTATTVGTDDKAAFNAAFLIDPSDPQINALKEAFKAAANEKWGAKGAQMLAAIEKADKVCLHDGAMKPYEGYEGMLFISARNPVRPLVLDANKAPLSEQDGRPYSGCYVNASLEIWAQDNKYGKRINATLLGVQFARDGEAFTGSRTGDAGDFDDVSSDEDLTGLV